MRKQKEILVKVSGNEYTLESIMDKVLHAKGNGLSNKQVFTPEIVQGLIFSINEASKDDDVAIKSYKGEVKVTPLSYAVASMQFIGETAYEEAKLANAIAELAEKTGLSANDVAHLIPLVFRMLKVKSRWAE